MSLLPFYSESLQTKQCPLRTPVTTTRALPHEDRNVNCFLFGVWWGEGEGVESKRTKISQLIGKKGDFPHFPSTYRDSAPNYTTTGFILLSTTHYTGGPSSSVGIATELLGWTVRDRIPVGMRFSAPVQTGPGAHPPSCKMGTGSFPGVKYGRGVLLTTHPLLVPRSWKSRAIPLPTLWATPAL